MSVDEARILLNRIPALEPQSDLDLLVFFARHTRTLMTSEQLGRLLGYRLNEIARSLDVLLAAGLLTRTQNPTRPARMYAFAPADVVGGWLPVFLGLASTRDGRLALRRALAPSPVERTDAPSAPAAGAATADREPLLVRRSLNATGETGSDERGKEKR
jgi:hypothetical protein